MRKLYIITTLIALVILAISFRSVGATNDVCFCHNVNNNPHTICTSNQGQINGHNNHVNNGEDTVGVCQEPTSSPSPTASPRVRTRPTCTPTASPIATDTPTASPSATPTISPTPEVKQPNGKDPPELSNPCYYLSYTDECKTKEEVFPGEGESFGPSK